MQVEAMEAGRRALAQGLEGRRHSESVGNGGWPT